MITSRSCSWCHVTNVLPRGVAGGTPVYCSHCGHRADLPRAWCDCPRCGGPEPDPVLAHAALLLVQARGEK